MPSECVLKTVKVFAKHRVVCQWTNKRQRPKEWRKCVCGFMCGAPTKRESRALFHEHINELVKNG